MKTLLFGSIGTLVETSEIQRSCFNKAFAAHGLDWHWSRSLYQKMLHASGGVARIRAYAMERNETVDALAIHNLKSKEFQKLLDDGTAKPREGVVETLTAAKKAGAKIGLVSTTLPRNVDKIMTVMARTFDRRLFDVITTLETVRHPKPKPEVYQIAMDKLGVSADDCIAIEDNTDGISAARDAHMRCVAFPGYNTRDQDYTECVECFEAALDPPSVLKLLA